MTEDDHGRANVRRGGLTKRGIEPFELSLRQPRVLRQRQGVRFENYEPKTPLVELVHVVAARGQANEAIALTAPEPCMERAPCPTHRGERGVIVLPTG